MLLFSIHLIFLVYVCQCRDATFKNVTIQGFNMYTEKFKKTIVSGELLKDHLPEIVIDAVLIEHQDIPILHTGSLAQLGDLDELTIQYCHVTDIQQGAIKDVPQLRKVSLKGNKIEHIKNEVFSGLHIAVLDFSENSIKTIDDEAFDNMPELLNIKLSDNQINVWKSNWFKNTPILTRVSMQNNLIEQLPDGAFKNFVGEKKFGKLDLSVNLIFSQNRIHSIHPSAFAGLVKINNLWLDKNQLESFEGSLIKDVEIGDLRIDHNKIKCLDGDLSIILKANTSHIDSNPFECTCLEKIKGWIKKNDKHIDIFMSDTTCYYNRLSNKIKDIENRLKEIKAL